MSTTRRKRMSTDKERFKQQLSILICGGNAYKCIELDRIFKKFSLEVLEDAWKKLKHAESEGKVRISTASYEMNCEWSDERINGAKKTEKRKGNRENIDDLFEKHPEFTDKIQEAYDEYQAKETIKSLIKGWEEDLKLAQLIKDNELLWDHMSVNGKKKVAEDLVKEITSDGFYALAYNKTREYYAQDAIPWYDVNRSAFFMAAKNYLIRFKSKYVNFIGTETELSYPIFDHFEERLDKALKRRGL